MLLLYGDDSSDEKKLRVSSVAVAVGTEKMWKDFEAKWVVRTNGVPFHAKDCESDWGDYKNTSHEENKALYRDLVTLLAESDLGGYGVAIDLVAQKEVFPESLDLAYYKAFLEIIDVAVSFARQYGRMAKLKFDVSTENEYNAGLLYTVVRNSGSAYANYLNHEIAFGPARECPRLQVGDLIAFESMKALDHSVGPVKRKRTSWDVLRATERIDAHAYGIDWFRSLKQNYGELERKVGFRKQHYLDWLARHRRQRSISNLFHFMEWLDKRDKK